jgi:hypothetical protein
MTDLEPPFLCQVNFFPKRSDGTSQRNPPGRAPAAANHQKDIPEKSLSKSVYLNKFAPAKSRLGRSAWRFCRLPEGRSL